jgi:predicted HTH transcriptional regulator
VTEADFESLLARGYEIDGVEFKGPWIRTDRLFVARVVQAILAMPNHSDGGLVILGVDESTKPVPGGLSDEQAQSWLSYDERIWNECRPSTDGAG